MTHGITQEHSFYKSIRFLHNSRIEKIEKFRKFEKIEKFEKLKKFEKIEKSTFILFLWLCTP